jgi:hypothetical protein
MGQTIKHVTFIHSSGNGSGRFLISAKKGDSAGDIGCVLRLQFLPRDPEPQGSSINKGRESHGADHS